MIDDQPLFVDAIGNVLRLLGPDIEILEAFSGGEGCRYAERAADLDLVILAWDLPACGGQALLKTIRRISPRTPVVVLSANGDADLVARAIRSGATGFIPKSAKRDLMLNALRLVMSGGVYFPAESLAVAIDTTECAESRSERREFSLTEFQRHKVLDLGLSNREIEVLELLVAGHANKVIGRRLAIAECTVKAHITSILRTLNAGSRTQAIYHVTHGRLAA